MEEKRPAHRPRKAMEIDPGDLDRNFFTIYEVADMMGFHWRTIQRKCQSGELPAKKYGNAWRIRKADLEAYTTPEKN